MEVDVENALGAGEPAGCVSRLNDVPAILKLWEEKVDDDDFSPTPFLQRLAEVVEAETEEYLKLDPDPFDDRHPLRTHPTCTLGSSLKAIFKKESLVIKLVDYLKEDAGFGLNVCASRLLVDLLPGLENSLVYAETESAVTRLFQWAETEIEPLASYALALLGNAMEVPDVAGKFREKNLALVPIVLKRLWTMQREFLGRNLSNVGGTSPGAWLEDSSSSSWAELESNIVATWAVYPADARARQIFALRYLAPLAEYQEMLSFAFEHDSLGLVVNYIERCRDARVVFEALKYLAALLCHKKFALEFVNAKGLQKLLLVPRPSVSATGASLCLYYIAYAEDAMELVCGMGKQTIANLANYVLWLLECSHHSGRNQALMFFSVAFPFRPVLEAFDAADGLRRVLNVVNTQRALQDDAQANDEELALSRQAIRQVAYNLKRYFESHLALLCEKIKCAALNTPLPHASKPLHLDASGNHAVLLHNRTAAGRWHPVEQLLRLNGLATILNVMAYACDLNFGGRPETLRAALEALAVCVWMPRAALALTETTDANAPSALALILSAADGEVSADPDLQRAALQLLKNCVSPPPPKESVQGATGFATPASSWRGRGRRRGEEALVKMWECVRMNNGVLVLTRLLQVKAPLTHADGLRALACECLAGLARYEAVRQVLERLPLLRSGVLTALMREPVLQEKKQEHLAFQKAALEIVRLVSVGGGDELARSALLSRTTISYDRVELLQLIHQHLETSGLHEVALKLMQDAKLEIPPAYASSVSLDKIMKDFLLGQHALCKTPMATCPELKLRVPHRCPSLQTRSTSLPSTLWRNQLGLANPQPLFRKIVYSKYRPYRVIRCEGEDQLTAVAYSPDDQWIIAGTSNGDVKLFSLSTGGEEGIYACHDSAIFHLEPNRGANLLLTSSLWRRPLSALWRTDALFDKLFDFDRDEYVEFSKLTQDKIVGTQLDHCHVYDVETGRKLFSLEPRLPNNYHKNRATFDPSDSLILSDGCLFDVRAGKEIHKFDKLNENVSGVFHPRGLEIIANTEVWDVRMRTLLTTVKQIDGANIVFNHSGEMLYGFRPEGESPETAFVVLDALDYSTVATFDVKRGIAALAPAPNDLSIALVETADGDHAADSVVRLYEVGRARENDEEGEEDEVSEEGSEDDDEDEEGDVLDDLIFEAVEDDLNSNSNTDDEEEDEEEEEEEEDEDEDSTDE